MKYKLIASDMDETLLNDHHEICSRNIELIKKAKEKGVKFVPATGRGYAAIQNCLKDLDLYDETDEYVISFNGGALSENKNNLEDCSIISIPYYIDDNEYGTLMIVGPTRMNYRGVIPLLEYVAKSMPKLYSR